jgi:hypothetical protein
MVDERELARRGALWAGVEDWTGLWEVAWEIQTNWPELVGQPAQDMARSILQELLAEGFVTLGFFKHEGNSWRPVAPNKALKLLLDEESWQPAGDREHVRFLTTTTGERELRRLEKLGAGPKVPGKARR